MNKTYATLFAGALITALPFIVSAEDSGGRMPPPPRMQNIEEHMRSGSASSTRPMMVPPPVMHRELEGRMGMGSSTRPEMRERMMGSTTGMMRPEGVRPPMIRLMGDEGSSTRPFPMRLPMPPLFKRFASSTLLASSTVLEHLKDDHQEVKQTRLDLFAWKQNNLVTQLTQALTNLKQIRDRVAGRINQATTNGSDTTNAVALLATADTDIATANASIQALAAYVPPGASGSAQASTTVDLNKPRAMGADTIKAVNTVRDDLSKTVEALGSITNNK